MDITEAPTPHALPSLWRERAATLEQYAADSAAMTCRTLAEELEMALHALDGVVVTPTEAAQLGGYSVDHINRMIRTGKIENVGRKGAPRLRRADVPIRAGYKPPGAAVLHFAPGGRTIADVRADLARSVVDP
jgi:hypothetical protein